MDTTCRARAQAAAPGALAEAAQREQKPEMPELDISTEDQNQFRQQVERLITQQPDAGPAAAKLA